MANQFVMVNGIKTQEMGSEPLGDLTPLGSRFRIGQFFHVVCECVCGNIVVSSYQNMKCGATVSCGCRKSSDRRSSPSRLPPCGTKSFPPGPHKLEFIHSTKETDECINWPYGIDHHGYGVVHVDGKRTLAHRQSAIVHHGHPPEGHFACHSCGNKKCINPRHVYWGTRKNNYDDAIEIGEMAHSEENGMAKLTNIQVAEIKTMLASETHTINQIAQMYGRNYITIHDIKSGRTWRRVQASQAEQK